jgi:hypothetical protein
MTSLGASATVGTLKANKIFYTQLTPSGGGVAPISNPMTSDLDCNGAGGPYDITNANNITCNNINFTTSIPPIPTGFVNNPLDAELKGGGQNFTNINDIGCNSLTASGLVQCVSLTAAGPMLGAVLTVNGNTNINGALTATGGITSNGGLTVNGDTNINGAAVLTGTLGVGGQLTCNTITTNTGPNNISGGLTTNGALNAFGGISATGNIASGGSIGATGNATFGGYVRARQLQLEPAGTAGALDPNTPYDLAGATLNVVMGTKSKARVYCFYGVAGTAVALPVIKFATGIANILQNASVFVSVQQAKVGGTSIELESYRIEQDPGATDTIDLYITMNVPAGIPNTEPIRINLLYVAD